METFDSLFEAKIVIEDWRNTYNTIRPHSSLELEDPRRLHGKLEEH